MEKTNYLELYEDSIKNFNAISNVSVVNLIRKAQNGDENARNEVIEHNLKFTLFISKMFSKTNEDIMNIVSYGNEALILAIDNYNVNSSTKFITYLGKCIYWYIKRNLAKENFVYSISITNNIEKIKKYCDDFLVRNEREATDEEIKKALKVNQVSINAYRNFLNNELIISNVDENELLGEEDKNIENLINDITKIYFINRINNSNLTNKEKFTILYRYGFIDDEAHTLDDIGALYKISRQRVSEIEKKAISKLSLSIKR